MWYPGKKTKEERQIIVSNKPETGDYRIEEVVYGSSIKHYTLQWYGDYGGHKLIPYSSYSYRYSYRYSPIWHNLLTMENLEALKLIRDALKNEGALNIVTSKKYV